MSIDYNVLAQPKGRSVKQVRAKAKRQDVKGLNAWRDEAWAQQPGGDCVDQWGCCADCQRIVYRRREFTNPAIGQVHHIISRRHKATRTAASNAVILCRKCHNKRHGREF